ncbi:helix-hairpin-helix domain-containing protein [Paenibacillus sp.]|uniref:ComEA family DNA-binding protein n=1 Tax=Paenibacillus sp. TaxID=58172 RepID=UPI002D6A512C|nr:helix-hairpin-helix domain-containing protein [Paenibacillus sp.]HZG84128.1 helix-hairpin-helix domain-containing protein [Paenibacillus sp.]
MFAQYKSLTIVLALAGAYFLLASAYGREGAPAEAAWLDANAEIAAWLEAGTEPAGPEAAPPDGEADGAGAAASTTGGPGAESAPQAEGHVSPEPQPESQPEPPLAESAPPGSSAPSGAAEPSLPAKEAAPAEAASSGLVDVNRATAEQLDALPGIGPAKAAAIVAYREAEGPFRRKEDLLNVKGIGPSIFAKIEAAITVAAEDESGK